MEVGYIPLISTVRMWNCLSTRKIITVLVSWGNGIYAMLKDRQRNLWAGSYTGGISLLRLQLPVATITHKSGDSNSLANDNVNAIAENINGDIWYATDRGVSVLLKSGRWVHAMNKNVGVTLCLIGKR